MKILFINPPYANFEGLKESGGHMLPLSFGYLASYAREQIPELYFEVLDCEAEGLNYEQIENRVKNAKPDVVGITAPTPAMKHVYKMSEIIKEAFPKTKVVCGGIHPTVLPERTMVEGGKIDFIIIGEGEITFTELLWALKKGQNEFSNILGLCWRKGNKIIVNQRRGLIKDLNALPFPARDIFNLKLYYSAPTKKVSEESATPIITSRGCPFNCIHCPSRIIWEGYIRYRNAANVVAEIEECINKYNLREFNFFDDTFTVDKNRVMEICHKIVERKLRIYWICMVRVNLIDEELVKTMKEAGCRKISFGLESGNQRILDLMRKKTTVEQGRTAVQMVKKYGLEAHAGLMLGNVGETAQTIKETINFAKSLPLDNATFFITCPFPGTDLYQIAQKLGNINQNTKWEEFAPLTVQRPILVQNNLTGAELIYWQKRAFREFYLRPKYIIKKLWRIRGKKGIKSLLEGMRIFLRILFKK
jgi:anaerobic magnesium-protoporphyrin IX monomethyl ester cyclase